ncbi:glycosyltransferase [Cellvibrio sp. pealriver]|uniref:glycosyltransferase n=1 Tax=Cellvibrio sp. pealriver TaxID=1622269 RepID=UPI00066FFDA5|nr:glycosyltransferase [Cellvibrio sp. pealriver]
MMALNTMSRLGHQLDGTLQRYKSLVYPQRYVEYRRWLHQQNRLIPQDKPLVVFDFRDSRIDGPQGRRFYCLFIFFIRAGFYPVFRENYLVLGNMREKHKQFCLQEAFSVLRNERELRGEYVLVTDKMYSGLGGRAGKIININYQPGYQPTDACFPMPFPMFSPIYACKQDLQLTRYQNQTRQWQIFFGGDAKADKYNKQSIRTIYNKLSRAQILQILSSTLDHEYYCELNNQAELNQLKQTTHTGVVVMNNRHCKVAPEQWLSTLAQSRFFIACPGVRYPMSHNLVESMAVGTIPITQYPELFFPALEDGKNCLVFSGEKDLVDVIKMAINMSERDIATIAKGAIRYYDEYLSPHQCIDRLLSLPQDRISLRILPFLKQGGGFA